ncbi:cathepsin L1-like [Mizuhopecten yessoensis]|uniref:Digestive cysteine proteinase 2 n=1 Tax=Mizuhopecten yessoensis TaxID=6573 RepID=A0A210PHM8_MIZYE|nr:cathepsin L1-like [Mizuhopecten yessoensis]OWF35999.1 Digestive cysteine proteinase 2 [Mizuhopecten yessoensis]
MMLAILCCMLTVVAALPNVEEWYQVTQTAKNAPTDLSPYHIKFVEFQVNHNKSYPTVQERSRKFEIFKTNVKIIEEHNKLYVAGQNKFFLGINQFTDMDSMEYSKWLGSYMVRKSDQNTASTFLRPSHLVAPAEVDWRTLGYVTPVKNQGQCGACWAFSATGSLEGQHFKKTGTLIALSEQQLNDCSTSYGNQGCNGGLMDNAFRYIADNGIESEAAYPYTAKDGVCQYDPTKVVAKCTGMVDIQANSETQLLEAVAAIGPISVAIDASHPSFQQYAGGVYDEPSCSSTQLDHGVLVVGYGSLNANDMWIVKNSWGALWGDQGYVMMSRNANNQCGIASMASYPLV